MAFDRLFNPRGVAIIGASQDPSRIGGHPIKALKAAGYPGGIFPVNPKYTEVAGLPCVPSAEAIGRPCDLAVVAVPAAAVPDAIRDCGRAGIGFAVVLSGGFREAGAEGRALEQSLKRAALEAGVRVVGPNCQGLLSIPSRTYAVFGSVAEETELRAGGVSCAFQSGGFGYGIVNLAELQGVGFRHCVSTGNEADISMPEMLSAFLDDPGTTMAFGLLEGTPDARALLDLGAKSRATGKPVLIWKVASSEAGARAAQSHTASMTGSIDIYRAAFRQSGLIEVDDVEPIIDVAKLVALGRLPRGRSVGVISISGGSGIVLADRATARGLALPPFSDETIASLKTIIPSFGSAENPADVTAGAFNDLTLLTHTLDIVLAEPGIDQLAVLLASTPGAPALRVAEAIVAALARTTKPVTVGWSGRRSRSEAAYAVLEAAHVPIVPTPGRLADALGRLARFATDTDRLRDRAPPPALPWPADLTLPNGAATLSEAESKRVLAAFGVATTREVLVPEGGDAAAMTSAAGLSGPFAVKIASRDIPHKSDAGCVRLAVPAEGLAEAHAVVLAKARHAVPQARVDGVLVAEMATGAEALVGVVADPSFGPAVALGLGGVLTEILHDVTYRIAPFDLATAHEMIGELKGARLLAGYRGSPPADVEALAALLVRISQVAMALGPRLAELDLNPVLVGSRGAVVADALLVLAPSSSSPQTP